MSALTRRRPSWGSPIPFLRTLVESERLVVQTTPYLESPSTAIFALAGAEAAISPIAEECGWILDRAEAAAARAEAAAAEAAAAARLASYTNVRFPLSNLTRLSTIDDMAGARGELPEGIYGAYFPGMRPHELQAIMDDRVPRTVHCPRAGMVSGRPSLVECRVEEP